MRNEVRWYNDKRQITARRRLEDTVTVEGRGRFCVHLCSSDRLLEVLIHLDLTKKTHFFSGQYSTCVGNKGAV